MSTLYTMVAPCFFGTESTLNFEVKRLGAQNIQVTDGRVAFQGGADMIAAANLNLRTAERVLLLLATYKATTFDEFSFPATSSNGTFTVSPFLMATIYPYSSFRINSAAFAPTLVANTRS